jgi:opacity protein-like surface antigen
MFRCVGLLGALVLAAAVPAAAQDEPKFEVNIGGGFTGVYGAASDRIGNGGNFTLGGIFHLTPVVSLQGEYGWNGMKQKQLSLPVSVTPSGDTVPTDFFADANMQYGNFNVMFNPPVQARAKPYVLAGLGVYYRPVTISTPGIGFVTVCDPYWYVCYPDAVSVDNVIGKRSSTDFGMNFGGGVNFRLAERASIYFEVRYHYIWGPQVNQVNPLSGSSTTSTTRANGQFVPITVGFRF